MITKYGAEFDVIIINKCLKRITNQIYKLLPYREEGVDWQKPLGTILEEISGLNNLLLFRSEDTFSLLCKLEGLFLLTREEDFNLYRRTIFECLGLINDLGAKICQEQKI